MKLKKMIAFVLAATLAISSMVVNTSAASFSDTQGHWAEKGIDRLVEKGVISGKGDGTFGPDDKITRAQFSVMLNRAFDLTREADINFSDIGPNDFYYPQIRRAIAAGYLSGYPENNTVKPDGLITRNEAATMLSRLLNLAPQPGAADRMADIGSIPSWAKPYIESAVFYGIMGNYPDGTFGPTRNLTKAEAASQISIAMEYYNSRYSGYKPAEPIGDITISSNYGPASGATTVNGTATITANGITVQNLVIKGDLIIDPTDASTGTIYLKNVKVEGTIYVKGNAKSVYFTGTAANVVYSVPGGYFNFQSGSIGTFTVEKEAEGCRINVDKGAVIDYAVINAKCILTGRGEITKALISAKGVSASAGLIKSYADGSLRPSTVSDSSVTGGYWNGGTWVWPSITVPGTDSKVISVTVTPDGELIPWKNSLMTLQFSAEVEVTGSASKNVTWACDGEYINGYVTISSDGLLSVDPSVGSRTISVTATSTADTSKSDTVTVTIGPDTRYVITGPFGYIQGHDVYQITIAGVNTEEDAAAYKVYYKGELLNFSAGAYEIREFNPLGVAGPQADSLRQYITLVSVQSGGPGEGSEPNESDIEFETTANDLVDQVALYAYLDGVTADNAGDYRVFFDKGGSNEVELKYAEHPTVVNMYIGITLPVFMNSDGKNDSADYTALIKVFDN